MERKNEIESYKPSNTTENRRAAAEQRLVKRSEFIHRQCFVDFEVYGLAVKFHDSLLTEEVSVVIKDRRMDSLNRDFLPILEKRRISDVNAYLMKEILQKISIVDTIRVIKGFISFLSEFSELPAAIQIAALNSVVDYKASGVQNIIDYVDDIENVVDAYVSGKKYVARQHLADLVIKRIETQVNAANNIDYCDVTIKKMCLDYLELQVLTKLVTPAVIYGKVLTFNTKIVPNLQYVRVTELDVHVIKEMLYETKCSNELTTIKGLIAFIGEQVTIPTAERFKALSLAVNTCGNKNVIVLYIDAIMSKYHKISCNRVLQYYPRIPECAFSIRNMTFSDKEIYELCDTLIENVILQGVGDVRGKVMAINSDILPLMRSRYLDDLDIEIIKELVGNAHHENTLSTIKSLIGTLAEYKVEFPAQEQFKSLNNALHSKANRNAVIQLADDIISGRAVAKKVARPEKLIDEVVFLDPEMQNLSAHFQKKVQAIPSVVATKGEKLSAFKNDILPTLQQTKMQDVSASLIQKLLEISKSPEKVWVIKNLIAFFAERKISKEIVAINSLIIKKTSENDLLDYLSNIDHIGRYRRCIKSGIRNSALCKQSVLYIDTDVPEIQEALVSCYFERANNFQLCLLFLNNFNQAAGRNVKSIYDLTFSIMMQQLTYIDDICKKEHRNSGCYYSFIKEFYLYIQKNYIPDFFDKVNIPIGVVHRTRFMKEMVTGFVPVHENHFEPTPKSDKWLLIYDNKREVNSQITTSSSKELDFSKIKDNIFRQLTKNFIWAETKSVGDKQYQLYSLRKLFEFIDNLYSKKVISIYARNFPRNKLTEGIILAYKDYLQQMGENSYYLNNLYCIKEFVFYLQDTEPSLVDENVVFHLSNLYANKKNTARAMSDDELARVATVVNNNQETIVDILCSIVFYLLITTEIRASQILSLPVDSVREAGKKGQYVLVSKNKMTGVEAIPQPITIETKRSLDYAIKLTRPFRDNCDASIKDYIFISPNLQRLRSHNLHKVLRISVINKYLTRCCKIAQLEHNYTVSNLRDTHITLAREHVLRNNLTHIDQMVLSGHNNVLTDSRHYIDSIRTLTLGLEAANHVIIGDVTLAGKVIENEKVANSDTVEHGCGFCSSTYCNMNSFLGCLMCKSFVTMPSRISYFYDYIKIIDTQMESKTLPHDIEDLVNIKRLLIAYLRELLIIKDGDGDDVYCTED